MTLTDVEKFFQSNFDFELLLSNSKDLVRFTKDDFINRLTANVGDEAKNKAKKDSLNLLRLQLAFRVLTKFQVKKDIQIKNLTKAKHMANDICANDIWILLNSFVDEKLSGECNEIVFQNSKVKKDNLNATNDMTYVNTNDLSIVDDSNSDLRQILVRMQKEMTELKESNLKILETVSRNNGYKK